MFIHLQHLFWLQWCQDSRFAGASPLYAYSTFYHISLASLTFKALLSSSWHPHDILWLTQVFFGTRRFWGLFFNLLAPFVGALCISTLRTGVAGLFDPTNCLSGTTSSLVYSSQIKFNLAPPMQILVRCRACTWTLCYIALLQMLYCIIFLCWDAICWQILWVWRPPKTTWALLVSR